MGARRAARGKRHNRMYTAADTDADAACAAERARLSLLHGASPRSDAETVADALLVRRAGENARSNAPASQPFRSSGPLRARPDREPVRGGLRGTPCSYLADHWTYPATPLLQRLMGRRQCGGCSLCRVLVYGRRIGRSRGQGGRGALGGLYGPPCGPAPRGHAALGHCGSAAGRRDGRLTAPAGPPHSLLAHLLPVHPDMWLLRYFSSGSPLPASPLSIRRLGRPPARRTRPLPRHRHLGSLRPAGAASVAHATSTIPRRSPTLWGGRRCTSSARAGARLVGCRRATMAAAARSTSTLCARLAAPRRASPAPAPAPTGGVPVARLGRRWGWCYPPALTKPRL